MHRLWLYDFVLLFSLVMLQWGKLIITVWLKNKGTVHVCPVLVAFICFSSQHLTREQQQNTVAGRHTSEAFSFIHCSPRRKEWSFISPCLLINRVSQPSLETRGAWSFICSSNSIISRLWVSAAGERRLLESLPTLASVFLLFKKPRPGWIQIKEKRWESGINSRKVTVARETHRQLSQPVCLLVHLTCLSVAQHQCVDVCNTLWRDRFWTQAMVI